MHTPRDTSGNVPRRSVLAGAAAALGWAALDDENAMADKIGHDWKNRESYDADDGSVVDW
jgi:hypothetical protein